MRRLVTLLGLLCLVPFAQSKQADDLRQQVDRAAIMDTMHKYIWTVDSLDADGYVSVFTEDAVIEQPGSNTTGHEAIRKVVTGMASRQGSSSGIAPDKLSRMYLWSSCSRAAMRSSLS